VSSQHRDLELKPALYAEAGVAEYWVVDLEARRLIVHRDPNRGEYGQRLEVVPSDRVSAAVLCLPQLAVDDLLASATRRRAGRTAR